MKKLLVLLAAFIIGTSAFAVDIDTIVKSSKYTPFIMMQTGCEDEDVAAITGTMLINMNENMLEFIPTGEMSSMRYTNWPEAETTNFIEAFLYFLYKDEKSDNVIKEGSTLVKTVLPNVDDERANKIVLGAYIETVFELTRGE